MFISRKKLSLITCLTLLCVSLSLPAAQEPSAPQHKDSTCRSILEKTKKYGGICCLAAALVYANTPANLYSPAPAPMKMVDNDPCEFNPIFQKQELLGRNKQSRSRIRVWDERYGRYITHSNCTELRQSLCIKGKKVGQAIFTPIYRNKADEQELADERNGTHAVDYALTSAEQSPDLLLLLENTAAAPDFTCKKD